MFIESFNLCIHKKEWYGRIEGAGINYFKILSQMKKMYSHTSWSKTAWTVFDTFYVLIIGIEDCRIPLAKLSKYTPVTSGFVLDLFWLIRSVDFFQKVFDVLNVIFSNWKVMLWGENTENVFVNKGIRIHFFTTSVFAKSPIFYRLHLHNWMIIENISLW